MNGSQDVVGSVTAWTRTCVDRIAQWNQAMARFERRSHLDDTSGTEVEDWRRSRRRGRDDGGEMWRMAERMRYEETRLQASRDACFRNLQEKCEEKEKKAKKYKEKMMDICHKWKQHQKKMDEMVREKQEAHEKELDILRLENKQMRTLVEIKEKDWLDRESKFACEVRNHAAELSDRQKANVLLSQEVDHLKKTVHDLRQQENASEEKSSRLTQRIEELELVHSRTLEKDKTTEGLQKRLQEVEQMNKMLQQQNLHLQTQNESLDPALCGNVCSIEKKELKEENSRLKKQNQKLLATISLMRKEMEEKATPMGPGRDGWTRQQPDEAQEHFPFSTKANSATGRDLLLNRDQVREMSQELIALREDRDKLLELSNRLHSQLRDWEGRSVQRCPGKFLHKTTLSTSLLPSTSKSTGKTSHVKPLVRNYNLKDN